ncbi:antitermination protein [Klebsiella oxytoca]|uniref:antiterminator Q family protein n=1 Tax=Klebsiella oxytoca TaxID=571 RepID=UPI000FDA0AE2|nr:antiterminator Q family protein [Klebsiella oxytoca]MBZ7697002.1 antitermination protein [Klebsiella oxytoca]RVT17871.1 antitermination protein [Klebsiella oxytoca]HED2047915.1 antitermination protein [Klebsiella oxytoca]
MRDMYDVMDRWGAWAAADDSGVDWRSVAAGFKGLLPHGKKSRLQCDDDEGIMIDCCVSRLRKYKPDEYELFIAHFVIGLSLRTIAKKMKCSDGTIRHKLQSGLGFVSGVLATIKEYQNEN